jgi:hypothetical protein
MSSRGGRRVARPIVNGHATTVDGADVTRVEPELGRILVTSIGRSTGVAFDLLASKCRMIDRPDRKDRVVSDEDSLVAEWQLDVRSWLVRVFPWDGVLPVCIALAPSVIGLVLPNKRGAIEITAVVLPIAAFLIRFRAGKRHIGSNHCCAAMKIFQLCIFCLGILALVLVDAFVVLLHVIPWHAGAMTADDLLVLAIPVSIYLALMALAMYPGRRLVSVGNSCEQPEDWEHDPYRESLDF